MQNHSLNKLIVIYRILAEIKWIETELARENESTNPWNWNVPLKVFRVLAKIHGGKRITEKDKWNTGSSLNRKIEVRILAWVSVHAI